MARRSAFGLKPESIESSYITASKKITTKSIATGELSVVGDDGREKQLSVSNLIGLSNLTGDEIKNLQNLSTLSSDDIQDLLATSGTVTSAGITVIGDPGPISQ